MTGGYDNEISSCRQFVPPRNIDLSLGYNMRQTLRAAFYLPPSRVNTDLTIANLQCLNLHNLQPSPWVCLLPLLTSMIVVLHLLDIQLGAKRPLLSSQPVARGWLLVSHHLTLWQLLKDFSTLYFPTSRLLWNREQSSFKDLINLLSGYSRHTSVSTQETTILRR